MARLLPFEQPFSFRFVSLLLPLLLTSGCAARGPTPLHCADGALPCADQVVAIHCESLTDGTAPPDVGEVRWMFDGAKIPQRGEPPVSLTAWCSGSLEVSKGAAAAALPIELYQGIEGGHIQVPGRERIWFETPPEEPEAKRARICVDEPIPVTLLKSMTCKPIAGGTLWTDAQIREKFTSVKRVTADEFGYNSSMRPLGWCEAAIDPSTPMTEPRPGAPAVTLQNGLDPKRKARIDVFTGDRAWLRLPGERRLCLMPKDASG